MKINLPVLEIFKICLIAFLLNGCSYSGEERYTIINDKNISTGEVLKGLKINNEKMGYWCSYNEQNKLTSERYYLNDKLNGEYKSYFENGGLSYMSNLINGVLDGETKSYSRRGNLLYSGSFDQGVRTGKWEFYSGAHHGSEWGLNYVIYFDKGNKTAKLIENNNLEPPVVNVPVWRHTILSDEFPWEIIE